MKVFCSKSETLVATPVGIDVFADYSGILGAPLGRSQTTVVVRELRGTALHRTMKQTPAGSCAAIWGLQVTLPAPSSLEQTFASFLEEAAPAGGVQLRVVVSGKIASTGSDDSGATLSDRPGSGHQCVAPFRSDKDRGGDCVPAGGPGLRGMRERATNIGARLVIWSRPRAGTEVRVAAPAAVVMAPHLTEGGLNET